MSTIVEHIEQPSIAALFGMRQTATLSEGEAILGISHTKMKRLIQSGKVQSIKVGGSRRIPVAVLMELAQKGTE